MLPYLFQGNKDETRFMCMLSFIHEVTEPVPLQLEHEPNTPLKHAEKARSGAQMCYTVNTISTAEPEPNVSGLS